MTGQNTTAFKPEEPDDDATLLFLETLLAQKPADAHLLAWTLPNKLSRSFTSVTEAYRYIASVRDKANVQVYLGVGLSSQPVESANRRFAANQINGIYALWADIDVADETAHKKGNLPPTIEDAIRLVRDTGLIPTMIVHTGHGLQAWWVLKEPWMFGDFDRDAAMKLVTDWQYGIKTRAKLRAGWEVDSVQDLARVLRVAGTINCKTELVPVRILELNDFATYTLDDIRAAIARSPIDVTTTTSDVLRVKEASAKAGPLAKTLTINPAAEPPHDKLHRLEGSDIEAAKIYRHSRKLNSASDCDFALACAALQVSEDVGVPWTEQEITNLLIAHRRMHHSSTLASKLRPDYFARTIERARADITSREATERLGELIDARYAVAAGNGATANISPFPAAEIKPNPSAAVEKAETTPAAKGVKVTVDPRWQAMMARETARGGYNDEPEFTAGGDAATEDGDATGNNGGEEADSLLNALHRGASPERVLAGLSESFKFFRVMRIRKMIATPPIFSIFIQLPDSDQELAITLGTIEVLTSFRLFRNQIAAYSGLFIDQMKAKAWENIVRSMLAVAEPEDIGEEATEEGQIRSWLQTYLVRFPIEDNWDDRPPLEGAFKYGQHVHILGKHFEHWLRVNEQEKVSMRQIGQMLRGVGAETATVSYKKLDGNRTSMSTWRLPDEIALEFLDSPKADS